MADEPVPTDPAEAAERYGAGLGWAVVPITPGGKHPQLNRWQDVATTDLNIIRRWWTGPYRGHGVGLLCGVDFWVLDVDTAAGKPGALSLAELYRTHGPLPDTVCAITGSGGLHYLFAWDPGRPVSNGDAIHLGPGLDIRGTGGQIVVAPTVHPNGVRYQWMDGRDPWSVELAAAPGWLYELIHPPEAPTQPAQPAVGAPAGNGIVIDLPTAASDSDSIAAWIRSQHDWRTELEADGWTLHSTKPGGDTWWTRPGKNRSDGHSAVLHAPDGPLVVFTTEIPPELVHAGARTADGSAVSVSMFGYLAGMRHGGDRSALARSARHEQRSREPVAVGATTGAEPTGGFTDLAGWWDDPSPQHPADTCLRTDGVGLLYVDQLNWIHGDSGSGKTWILLHAVVQLIDAGHHVAWIHYEDPTPALLVGRLRQLGCDRAAVLDRFHYWDPVGEPLDVPAFIDACQRHEVVFAGLDSIGEALNAAGINEDSDTEVGPWISSGPRAIVNAGIGFCGVDHGIKNPGPRKLHPSGSKRKRAALTGAGLLIESLVAPTQTTDGSFKITCAKDRHGNHAQGHTIGIAHLRHNLITATIDFTITPPATDSASSYGDDDVERQHQIRVREAIRIVNDNPGLTHNQIRSLMPGAGNAKRDAAIQQAINDRHIRIESGLRGSYIYYPASDDDESF